MSFLQYLKASAFSHWLSVSMAGAPTMIALHSVGMGIVVGLSLMISLRLHRVILGFDERLIPRLLTLAAWGLCLNLVTGLAIFITRGPEYLASAMFLTKMLLVAISATLMFWLRHRLSSAHPERATGAADELAKRVSLVATLTWFGAVITGRLIAYLSDLYR